VTGEEESDVAKGDNESSPTADAELRNTREVAKGWWQGVTGLFGLFSVGTVIFAADAVGGLGTFGKVAFAIAAFLAAVLSGVAIARSLRAAHGWPSRKELRRRFYGKERRGFLSPAPPVAEGDTVNFERDSLAKLTIKAAEDLRLGVFFGAAALGCLLVALGIVWFAGDLDAEPRVFNVQAIDERNGESVACGVLVALDGTDVILGEPSSRNVAQEGVTLKQVVTCPP
jgi:hypothetical protein